MRGRQDPARDGSPPSEADSTARSHVVEATDRGTYRKHQVIVGAWMTSSRPSAQFHEDEAIPCNAGQGTCRRFPRAFDLSCYHALFSCAENREGLRNRNSIWVLT